MPLASLTLDQPEIVGVFNSVKVDASLKPGRAKVRLEMMREEDCQAEFSCQIRFRMVRGMNSSRSTGYSQGMECVRPGQMTD